MKRIKLLLMSVMSAVFLSACAGGGTTDVVAEPEAEKTVEEGSVETAEVEEKDTKENEEKPKLGEIPEFDKSCSIEETVVYDENDIKITAISLECKASTAELSLLLENNSSQNLSFTAGTLGYGANAVNGYMVDSGYLNSDVTAGNKANETVQFNLEELMIHGITKIADVHVGIKVQDDGYNEVCKIDCHVETSAASGYDYVKDSYIEALNSGILEGIYGCTVDFFAEEEIYNMRDLRVISEALVTNDEGEQSVFLEIINDSDKMLYGSISNVSLNGLMIEPGTWTGESVYPKCRRVMLLSLSDMLDPEYLQLFGITEAGEVALDFTVLDEGYDALEYPETLTIKVSDAQMSLDTSGDEIFSENGIRIISKGLMNDTFSLSDDVHLIMLVENGMDKTISIDDEYDSLSVNGFMSDCIMYSSTLAPGAYGFLDLEIQASSLESNGIGGLEDIEKIELGLTIKDDNYKTVGEPKLNIAIK